MCTEGLQAVSYNSNVAIVYIINVRMLICIES